MYTEVLKSGRYRHQITFIEARSGKKKKISTTTDRNTEKARREAEQVLNERIRQINGCFTEENETLQEAFDAYLADMQRHWRPSTYRRNKFAGKALCEILRPDTLISRLTARYVSECMNMSSKSPTSLNELLVRLKGFLAWCWETERLEDVSWTKRLKPYHEPTTREKNSEKFLEREELTRLLPELKIDVNRYVISFLALSGLRIGEALALQKDDVDLDARLIRVTKTRDVISGELMEGAKTYSSNRDVYIQDELLTLCREIRRYMTEMSMKCGFRTELFFSDFDGRPLQYARLNKYFRENCERVIGRRLTLHSLRHTHASLMFEGGASLDAVSLRLGHADSRITKEIYLHVTEKLREQYNATFDGIKILS